MAQLGVRIDVRGRAEGIRILDIQGELTAGAEEALSAAFATASSGAKAIILNCTKVQSIDSFGAGLLISMLARVRKRKLRLLAYGLSEPCRRAFELTHLDTAVSQYADEAVALGSL